MTNFNSKVYFYFSSLISLLLFIPVFINSNIGSDWDSYALIGTYENFIKYNTYIQSRPPGFHTYELLIGLLIYVSDILGLFAATLYSFLLFNLFINEYILFTLAFFSFQFLLSSYLMWQLHHFPF